MHIDCPVCSRTDDTCSLCAFTHTFKQGDFCFHCARAENMKRQRIIVKPACEASVLYKTDTLEHSNHEEKMQKVGVFRYTRKILGHFRTFARGLFHHNG